MTQQVLADKLGITRTTLTKMEARKFPFGLDVLIKWCMALEVEIGLKGRKVFETDALEFALKLAQNPLEIAKLKQKVS